MTGLPETLHVQTSRPDLRLDAWLAGEFPMHSRATFARLIREGAIRVNDRPVKATHKPRAGELVLIHWPEVRPVQTLAQDIPLEILHEDEDLIVLNKPPGIVVHPAAGNEDGTLVNALLHHCQGQLSGIGGEARPGVVHRLDKDTSGCLVAAKHDRAHLGLSKQFAGREILKIYQAIVCGALVQESGRIDARIARHPSHRKTMTVPASAGAGREALTTYRVLEPLREATWIEARLHTGRTHQIRVHFKHLGHPLAGDTTYGNRRSQALEKATGVHFPRQMLHAWKLGFTHPTTGETLELTAPLPADFASALEALRLPL